MRGNEGEGEATDGLMCPHKDERTEGPRDDGS